LATVVVVAVTARGLLRRGPIRRISLMMRRTMESRAQYFNAIFERDDDPWRFRDSWYEQRKRDLTLAALPLRHYHNAFEPGCANGELSAQLASRCDRLLSADIAPRAVELAMWRLALFPHVSVELREMPRDWPAGRFDLIVISETAYYLAANQCSALVDAACAALTDGGTLLCCHWRRSSEPWALQADDVHRRFGQHVSLHRLTHVEDADFLLDVWSTDQAADDSPLADQPATCYRSRRRGLPHASGACRRRGWRRLRIRPAAG
jgi:cyclopropane fatty-acyl-phospholipid synthase-like methyltransferase